MEYCLSLLYVAMDELGMIWCMDAFMERRYKDWKFWGVFAVNLGVSFYLFNFVVSGITVLHTLIAYAVLCSLLFHLFFSDGSLIPPTWNQCTNSTTDIFSLYCKQYHKLLAVIVNLLYCQKDSSIKAGKFDTMANSISYIFVSFGQLRCPSYMDFHKYKFS